MIPVFGAQLLYIGYGRHGSRNQGPDLYPKLAHFCGVTTRTKGIAIALWRPAPVLLLQDRPGLPC